MKDFTSERSSYCKVNKKADSRSLLGPYTLKIKELLARAGHSQITSDQSPLL